MNKILAGLQILATYSPDFEMAAEHDQIWAGHTDQIKMSSEDLEQMRKMGWFIDMDSWSHYV